MKSAKQQHSEERMRQLERFYTAQLGDGWKSGPFVYLNLWQIAEAQWPMFEVFKAHHAQIASIPYSSAFEDEADQALAFLADGGTWSATYPSPGAWRVLHERNLQSLTVAAANEAKGNSEIIPVPASLPSEHYRIAAMLFLQWAMPLVLPPAAVPSFEVPPMAAPGNLQRN